MMTTEEIESKTPADFYYTHLKPTMTKDDRELDLPEDWYLCQCDKVYYIDDTENCELCEAAICADCGKRSPRAVCTCGCVIPSDTARLYDICVDHNCECCKVPNSALKSQLVCRICCGEIPGDRELFKMYMKVTKVTRAHVEAKVVESALYPGFRYKNRGERTIPKPKGKKPRQSRSRSRSKTEKIEDS